MPPLSGTEKLVLCNGQQPRRYVQISVHASLGFHQPHPSLLRLRVGVAEAREARGMNVHQLQRDDNHQPQKQLEASELANPASPEQLTGRQRQRRPHQHPQRPSHDPPGGGKPPELREHEHPRHHYQQQRRLRLGGMSKQTKSKPRRPTELARVASFVRDLRRELSPPPAEGLGFHSCSFRGAPSFQLPVRHYHHKLHQGGEGCVPQLETVGGGVYGRG